MPTSRADREQEFRDRYAASGADALIAAELEVLGSDYSANGYTTHAQADELGRLVGLGAGHRLLDLGSGCGWPGLYLAERHGCSVATIDPAHDGNVASEARAARDGLANRHLAVTARGWALPFASRSFDAIVHTDVLC
jgi:cyclopropane fatty-acyl-phospholipid synthase-like methyltransferase